MLGKKPLWVAKQHGHSLETMLRSYTAWAEGAVESDIRHVERAMAARPHNLSYFHDVRVAPLGTDHSRVTGAPPWAENRTTVA